MEQAGQIVTEALAANIINVALVVTGIAVFALLLIVTLFGWSVVRMLAGNRVAMDNLTSQTNALMEVRVNQEKLRADLNNSSLVQTQKIDQTHQFLMQDSKDRKAFAEKAVGDTADAISKAEAKIILEIGSFGESLRSTSESAVRIEQYVREQFTALADGLQNAQQTILAKIETMFEEKETNEVLKQSDEKNEPALIVNAITGISVGG